MEKKSKGGPVTWSKETKRDRSYRTGAVAWTEEEDKLLLATAATLRRNRGGRGLVHNGRLQLAALFPDRDKVNVFARFKTLKRRIADGREFYRPYNYKPWTEEEITKLKEIYSQDKFQLGLRSAFPDRHARNVIAKAMELGLSRRRLEIIPFRLSSEDAAFAAGMINGDGYIVFTKSKKDTSWKTCVGFVNTEKIMVKWFDDHVPRGLVRHDDPKLRSKELAVGAPQSRKLVWRWSLYDKPTIVGFLEQIYPYLLGDKKKRAYGILKKYTPIIANDIAESYLRKEVA